VAEAQEVARVAGLAAYDRKVAELDELKDEGGQGYSERLLAMVMLNVIDEKWKDHLYDLDQLRSAIHYRSWGQKDPLVEYKQEATTCSSTSWATWRTRSPSASQGAADVRAAAGGTSTAAPIRAARRARRTAAPTGRSSASAATTHLGILEEVAEEDGAAAGASANGASNGVHDDDAPIAEAIYGDEDAEPGGAGRALAPRRRLTTRPVARRRRDPHAAPGARVAFGGRASRRCGRRAAGR
jgi:preprotein translocase subunit SecA